MVEKCIAVGKKLAEEHIPQISDCCRLNLMKRIEDEVKRFIKNRPLSLTSSVEGDLDVPADVLSFLAKNIPIWVETYEDLAKSESAARYRAICRSKPS